MQDPLLIPELREYITENKTETLKAFFEKTTPAVGAEYLGAFDPAEVWRVIRTLKPDIGAEIFTFLEQDVQLEIAAAIKRQEFAQLSPRCRPTTGSTCSKEFRRSGGKRSCRPWPWPNGRISGDSRPTGKGRPERS